MVIVYVILAVVVVLAAVGASRRSTGRPRVTQQYNRALGVLAEMRERRRGANPIVQTGEPRPSIQATPDPPAPHLENLVATLRGKASEPNDAAATQREPLVFVDDALSADNASLSPSQGRLMRHLDRRAGSRLAKVAIVVVLLALVASVAGILSNRSRSANNGGRAAAGTSTTMPRSTTTSSTTLPAGGIPNLASLSPSSGSAGQTLTLSGSGFMSANGSIVATFDAHPAPTRCPTETQCFVTVPPGSKSATVRVKTQAGASNGLTFYYR